MITLGRTFWWLSIVSNVHCYYRNPRYSSRRFGLQFRVRRLYKYTFFIMFKLLLDCKRLFFFYCRCTVGLKTRVTSLALVSVGTNVPGRHRYFSINLFKGVLLVYNISFLMHRFVGQSSVCYS